MDAASLSALAQFLHEFRSSEFDTLDDGRSETSKSSTTSTTSETDATRSSRRAADESVKRRRTAQASQRQNRYLAKVRCERETLRQQATELTTVLQELKKAQARSAAQAAGDFSLAAWKSATVRQKERRLRAEAKQRHLKALVEEQTRVIRCMDELLQQRLVCGPPPSLQASPPSGPLFKAFVQELDTLYAMTNDVVARADFKLSARPLQFELTRDWSPDMTFLESGNVTTVPFGFEETSRALTRVLLEDANGTYSRNDEPKNTTELRRCMDFTQELGSSATLMLHSVVRKYVEADRVVFVWRALTEGQGDFRGLHTDETAWYVLRPATSAGEGSSLVLETYTRLIPVGFSLMSDGDARGNAFIKVLEKADEEDVDDMMQMFEQMLVNETHTVKL